MVGGIWIGIILLFGDMLFLRLFDICFWEIMRYIFEWKKEIVIFSVNRFISSGYKRCIEVEGIFVVKIVNKMNRECINLKFYF